MTVAAPQEAFVRDAPAAFPVRAAEMVWADRFAQP